MWHDLLENACYRRLMNVASYLEMASGNHNQNLSHRILNSSFANLLFVNLAVECAGLQNLYRNSSSWRSYQSLGVISSVA